MFNILYQPRTEDEVVVASFDNIRDATAHMELIKNERPRAFKYHRLETGWNWADSGAEQGI